MPSTHPAIKLLRDLSHAPAPVALLIHRSLANNQLATLPPGLFFTGSSLLLSSNIDISGNPFTSNTVPSTFGNASDNGVRAHPLHAASMRVRVCCDRSPCAHYPRPFL